MRKRLKRSIFYDIIRYQMSVALTLVKDCAHSLTEVKISCCVRKQFVKMFGLYCFSPYLCIVNQNQHLIRLRITLINLKRKKG